MSKRAKEGTQAHICNGFGNDSVGMHDGGLYTNNSVTKNNILKQVNSLRPLKYVRDYQFSLPPGCMRHSIFYAPKKAFCLSPAVCND